MFSEARKEFRETLQRIIVARLQAVGKTRVTVNVTEKNGKLAVELSGSDEEIKAARQILRDYSEIITRGTSPAD
jgi:hypothetical protein